MIIVRNVDAIPHMPEPCGLTLGCFDGLHPGHLALLKHLRSKVGKTGTLAVLTFSNHPSWVLGNKPVKLICSLEEKLKLLESAGVDLVILLEFTPELASLTYQEFLSNIHGKYPFSYFALGKGSSFGKNREGTEEKVVLLGKELGFQADYLNKVERNGEVVSSGKIRHYIEQKNFAKAKELLGRSSFTTLFFYIIFTTI